MAAKQHLIGVDLNRQYPQVDRSEGIFLYDTGGKRYLDGCSGALVANLGHSADEVAQAMSGQAQSLAYAYRVHFSSPVGEELAARFCNLTDEPMARVYFTNSGSEATEMAVKLARTRHLAAGEKGRFKVISRWQSYHGITMGALSWSGVSGRRADYQLYLKDFVHITPAYCYRCWFGRKPDTCSLECAQALESAILTQGPDTVAAFMAEPVVGAALAAAYPPAQYFRLVREICDRHGVLFIADEVMCGAGRTGGRYFACDHFPGRPDIIAFGKGVSGGYFPLAGAMISPAVANAITSGSGIFGASQSCSNHPVGMAVGLAALDYMEGHGLLARSAEMGQYLGARLQDLLGHPSLGDVRGMGLMWGLEFVQDKKTKAAFDPGLEYHMKVYDQALKRGLCLLPSGGCDRGQAGDMALIGPPLVITREQIDELCATLDEALTQAEQEMGL
jgi:adenosylmethionine-8-amino-7-oxononanoate aminotransferase